MLRCEDRIVASDDVLSATIDGELVLMRLASGNYFSFRDVSVDIWQRIAEPQQVSSLCAALIASYDAPEERIRNSVAKFLNELLQHGLIRVL